MSYVANNIILSKEVTVYHNLSLVSFLKLKSKYSNITEINTAGVHDHSCLVPRGTCFMWLSGIVCLFACFTCFVCVFLLRVFRVRVLCATCAYNKGMLHVTEG